MAESEVYMCVFVYVYGVKLVQEFIAWPSRMDKEQTYKYTKNTASIWTRNNETNKFWKIERNYLKVYWMLKLTICHIHSILLYTKEK